MSMTRQNYELLARAMGEAEAGARRGTKGEHRVHVAAAYGRAMNTLCAALAADSPRFNRARFMHAWIVAGDEAEARGYGIGELIAGRVKLAGRS
jgi:hypothetical protein